MVFVRHHACHWRTYLAGGGVVIQTHRRAIVGYSVLFLLGVGLFASSDSFQTCEHERKERRGYEQLHESGSSIVRGRIRLQLHASCALNDDGIWSLLASIAVAGFTFTLWRSTHLLYKAGERQIDVARQAADAATLSANASMVQERPHLFLSLSTEAIGYGGPDRTLFPQVEYAFKNFGRSPAIIDRYYIELRAAADPGELTERNLFHAYFDRIIPAGQSTGRIYLETETPFSGADRNDILLGKQSVFLYGWIRYSDVFGSHRARYYTMSYDRNLDRFLEFGGAERNREVDYEP